MFPFSIIKKRPIIAATIIYILFLIFLNSTGFFSPEKRSKIIGFIQKDSLNVTGQIISEPEIKNNYIFFLLKSSKIESKKISEKILVTYDFRGNTFKIGDIIEIRGKIKTPHTANNPGEFNYGKYLNRQNVYTLLKAFSIRKTGFNKPQFLYRFSLLIQKDIIKTIELYLPPKEASVLIPMVVGNKSSLSKEIKEEFMDAGVMHVLVVSGLNVGYVCAIFLGLFRLTGLRKRRSALLTIPFILFYCMMTGANPPILRASIMAVFVILSLSLAREPLIYHSLALSALTILLFDPQALFTASFQLSFAATIGIVYFYPYFIIPFKRFTFWIKNTIGTVFAVSLSAQLAVLPLLAYYFNKFSLIGILTNLIVVPLAGVVTAAGIFLYLIHFLSPFLASLAALLNQYIVNSIIFTVSYSSKLKYSIISLPSPSAFSILFYYGFLFIIFKIKQYPKLLLLIIPFLVVSPIKLLIDYQHSRNTLEINFLNIPFSNAVHVRFPNGNNYLIDTGTYPNSYYNTVEKILMPYFRSKGITEIERVFITGSNSLRYGVFTYLADKLKIKEIILRPETYISNNLSEFITTVKKKNILLKQAQPGDRFFEDGASITILSSDHLSVNNENGSLVILLSYKSNNVLLTGNMGLKEEEYYSNSDSNIKSHILQLPENGFRIPSNNFMQKVNPDILISYFPPKYKTNKKVYSLNQSGMISIDLGLKGISVEKFRK
ncbi:MAG: DNA internalization-related competence protein ComEC/Rec2 [Elusimicrobia bacterium]|nr:DNA internalization-related competence protein ComEC/Rec2 [Elusimicrobiota bacterium]